MRHRRCACQRRPKIFQAARTVRKGAGPEATERWGERLAFTSIGRRGRSGRARLLPNPTSHCRIWQTRARSAIRHVLLEEDNLAGQRCVVGEILCASVVGAMLPTLSTVSGFLARIAL